ncbi:hypothetical protein ATJ88_2166 [Isoptericola jiangsuensis]|uniref:(S)-ureidoglycine aminohydrolase cupin domain-containing protein n=1 Tax=Isoptericola jiangsuensis TaxID=548579 RepID=A0A2A9EZ95_9MICO|nr:cupin domain-containing protein [Isoptericola jiangsuensis]PFG43469.1 hypothetical protein ATJ88_2166 [Isoptericola jiangsuensis]
MRRLLDTTSPLDIGPFGPEDARPGTGHRPLGALGGLEVGVWEMEQGTADDTETDEVFVVLTGAGTVTFDDGEEIALAPGVAVRLRAGERTTWTVTDTLRKLYVA